MLIIAYPRDERFLARVPFQFELDPELIEMDRLLDDRKLVLRITHDLLLSAPQAAWNGRPSTPAEVTLRTSVLRHLMGWSYATVHDEIVGSAKWRWFCRIYDHPVPNHSTLCDRERLVRSASLHALNNRLVGLGQERKVTRGRKLRTDGTVIETNIHYPTDSRLLSDSARILGRLCGKARDLLHPHTPAEKRLFRNRSRRARRLARQIAHRLRGTQGQKNGRPGRKTVSPVGTAGRNGLGPGRPGRGPSAVAPEQAGRGARRPAPAVCAAGAPSGAADAASSLRASDGACRRQIGQLIRAADRDYPTGPSPTE